MGAEGFNGADVFDAPNGDNASVVLQNNLYHNGSAAIPADINQEVNVGDDDSPVIGNPLLPSQNGLVLPVYNGSTFGGRFNTIRGAFIDLANRYGRPAAGGAAIDAANLVDVPSDDLLGAARGSNPDLGAVEVGGALPPPGTPSEPNKKTVLSWLLLLLD